MSAPKFDFIDVSVRAFAFLWQNRLSILQLSWLPFSMKLLSFLIIIFLGLQDNYLRQGLVLLPSSMLEGWLVAYVLRMAVLKETWQGLLTGDRQLDRALADQRKRFIMGSMLIYTLIKLISALAVGLMVQSGAFETLQGGAPSSPPPQSGIFDAYFIGVAAFALVIWSFRYIWLYVPIALGYSVRLFLKKIFGFLTSFRMIAVWLVCFAPVYLFLMLFTKLLQTVFPGASLEEASLPYYVVAGVMQSAVELFVALVTALAMGYAVQFIMATKK